MQKSRTLWTTGVVLLGIGALLLLASGAYYSYGVFAKSGLSGLMYSSDRPSASSAIEAGARAEISSASDPDGDASLSKAGQAPYVDGQTRPDGEAAAVVTQDISPAEPQPAESPAGDAFADPAETGGGDAPRAASEAAVQEQAGLSPDEGSPGDATEPDGAGSGATSGSNSVASAFLPQSPAPESGTAADALAAAIFLPAPNIPSVDTTGYSDPSTVIATADRLPAIKITIPAVYVDSDVKDLEVVLLADSFAWETPKWVVGHIPSTARPGDLGQGWYFGHLESPIRGEGNVFQNLPEIPELLAKNETVHIVVETEGRKYLYQVYKTEVVYQDDLQVTDSGNQDITLVTCVPRFYYDNRLLVTAALIGVSES